MLKTWIGHALQKAGSAFFFLGVASNLTLLFWSNFQIPIFSLLALSKPHWTLFTEVTSLLGISYYIFQSISYLTDVYQKKSKPEESFWKYFTYILFFPQVICGPIIRVHQFIPQLNSIARLGVQPRWEEGIYLFSIGLGKKALLANQIEISFNPIWNQVHTFGLIKAWISVLSYALYIYFDFSGYTDMVIGLGRLFQIEFPQNFDRPYLAENPLDYWRRWHMSLSLWIKDYLFTPLNYYFMRKFKGATWSMALSLCITLLLAGIWHGAKITYVVYGLFHTFVIFLYYMTKDVWDQIPKSLRIGNTFLLVCLGYVFFKSDTIQDALEWLRALFGSRGLGLDEIGTHLSPLFQLLAIGYAIIFFTPRASGYAEFSSISPLLKAALGILAAASLFSLRSATSNYLYSGY